MINGWWKIEFTGVTDPSEHSLEHIAGLIKEGYTSGQILEEPQATSSKRIVYDVDSLQVLGYYKKKG